MKPPCPPKTDCWCETHPNHPNCVPDLAIESVFFGMMIVIMIMIIIIKNDRKRKGERVS